MVSCDTQRACDKVMYIPLTNAVRLAAAAAAAVAVAASLPALAIPRGRSRVA